ncbi:BatA and WFA domain-containing protein [Flavobacterium sp.]|uniref:vWA domain-containing protein n=1 Tax=Flavobacterium sp. TaxID=239 RepID=UPI0035AE12E4
MQFKHPEFLYFLFLLVIPILVHLFQLRRFKKEYFTNVKLLHELSIQTRKSSVIKKWLLLFTRLLLLAFLVIAFAQPFFVAKENAKSTNEMYIVLDNSYSMQAKGKKGELLKRAVQDLLENTPENYNFSLITSSESYWNTDIKSIQKDLQSLEYSPQEFRLDNIISKINARKSAFNKDIVVITDAVGVTEKQAKGFKKEDNVYFVIPEIEQKNNVSIDSVFIEQNLDNFYEIGVKLSKSGDEIKNVPLGIYNNEKLIAKTIIDLSENSKTVSFNIPKEEFNGYASITDKSLEYDNTYYFSISQNTKTNVISIGDEVKSSFLSRIYTPNEFNYKNFPLQGLDYNTIEKQDVIIINELKEIPQALQTTLKSFVNKGGNLVVIPSTESNTSSYNNLLSNFGSVQMKNLNSVEKKITKINFSHPILKSVFEKKVDNFQYPSTKNSYSISSNQPSVLTYEDQSPFLISIDNPLSSVYLFSAAIDKENSNFLNSPLVVLSFYNMAKINQKTGVNSIIIGEEKPFMVDASLGKDEILEVKNKNEKFIPVQQIMNSKVKLNFNENPKKDGNYTVFNRNNLVQNISFNYNRTESNLENVNPSIASNYNKINDINTLFNTIQTERTDSQLWKWFVLLSLLFVVLELLIQKFVK